MKLSQLWEKYLTDKQLEGYSKHTIKAYGLQHRLMLRYLGDLDIADVTIDRIKEYLTKQGHLKASSLAHRVRYIKSFFRWVYDEGYTQRNLTTKLKEPKSA